MKCIKILTLISIAAGLSACAGGSAGTGAAVYTGDSFGNYKCFASGNGYTATGWASNRADAEANALDKCREHSGTSCSLSSCNSEGAGE